MRAFAVTSYDRPLEPLNLPEPELVAGHALLEVLTCGVCFSDVKTSRGQMPFSGSLSLPHVPGHEICARVLATEPAEALPEGTLVVPHHYTPCRRCRRCRAGEENLCSNFRAWTGFTHPGGFQERLVHALDRLVVLPDGFDPVTAAPMTCALGTGYHAVVSRAGAVPGSTLAVIGLGGVGIHALQVARAAGCVAVGLDLSRRAIEVAAAKGLDARNASTFTNSSSGIPSLEEEGFDAVVVTAGAAAAYDQAAAIVRPGGTIVGVGYSVGSFASLETPHLVLGEITLVGSRFIPIGQMDEAIELVRLGLVAPVVDAVRPLEEVNEAFDDLIAGRIVGRTVLRVSS